MKKGILIIGTIILVFVIALLIIRQNFKNSPDYNYITAKIDIQKGNPKLISVGSRTFSPFDKKIDLLAKKYGFTNIYIEKVTSKNVMTGIENYNSVIESFLNLRNGSGWREKYKVEIDSIKHEF